MIALSTYQIFDLLSLDYTVSDAYKIHKNSILIYGGGGNFIDNYTYCKTF